MYVNYQIKSNGGVFYTSSTSPKEGYEKHEYVDKKTGEKKTTYRQYVNSIEGKLTYKSLRDSPLGERWNLTFVKDGVNQVLSGPVFRQGKNVDDYAKSLAQFIENLEIGKTYKVSVNSKNRDKQQYLYKNFYFTDVETDKSVEWAFKNFGEDSIVPKAIKGKDKVTGKDAWDFTDVNAFYYGILANRSGTDNAPAATPSSEAVTETSPEENAAIVDDLPF